MNLQRYDITEILDHTVVISRKTVESARNMISVTWAVNSQRYEISQISGHTVVISRKKVKSAKKTIGDTWTLIQL